MKKDILKQIIIDFQQARAFQVSIAGPRGNGGWLLLYYKWFVTDAVPENPLRLPGGNNPEGPDVIK